MLRVDDEGTINYDEIQTYEYHAIADAGRLHLHYLAFFLSPKERLIIQMISLNLRQMLV